MLYRMLYSVKGGFNPQFWGEEEGPYPKMFKNYVNYQALE